MKETISKYVIYFTITGKEYYKSYNSKGGATSCIKFHRKRYKMYSESKFEINNEYYLNQLNEWNSAVIHEHIYKSEETKVHIVYGA